MYISDATQTQKVKTQGGSLAAGHTSVFGTSQVLSLIDMSSSHAMSLTPADSFTEEEEDVTETAVESTHLGFLCKINRFTVLTAMIMWMVGKTRNANQQLNKAVAFLSVIKEKKAKDITQKDRECIQVCECKYYQMIRTYQLYLISSSSVPSDLG